MSLSNDSESDLLKLIYQNVNWALLGDATGLRGSTAPGNLYISLHTADPGEAGNQSTSEVAYTGYARVAVVRGVAQWTLSGTAPTQVANAALVQFGNCTAIPSGAQTATHFVFGRDSAGAGEIIDSGALNTPLVINVNVQPQFAIGALVATAD